MGCLLIAFIALSPRLAVGVLWLLTDWVDNAFNGVVLPIAGLIFLPWTTVLYIIGFQLGGEATPWGWLGVIIGLFLDIAVDAGWVLRRRKNTDGLRS